MSAIGSSILKVATCKQSTKVCHLPHDLEFYTSVKGIITRPHADWNSCRVRVHFCIKCLSMSSEISDALSAPMYSLRRQSFH